MAEPLEAFGACAHYKKTPKEKQYVVLHPRDDYSGDCTKVFLCCDMCRIQLIATMTEHFNKFQAGDACEVLECFYGHRFPSFNQYTVPRSEFPEGEENATVDAGDAGHDHP